MLELGEELLAWTEVGRVFRQEEEVGACGANEAAHGLAFV